MTKEALKALIEDLRLNHEYCPKEVILQAANELERLAQPEQEPRNVRERWNVELDGNDLLVCFNDHEKGDKCQYERYSPQRTWVGLTDEEISELIRETHNTGSFVRAIEAKLKQKNMENT